MKKKYRRNHARTKRVSHVLMAIIGVVVLLTIALSNSRSDQTRAGIRESVVYKTDTAEGASRNTIVVVHDFDVVVCNGVARSTDLAKKFAQVGSDYTRYSVAYDAFLADDDCYFESNLRVDVRPVLRIDAHGSGVVAIHRLTGCSECDSESPDEAVFAIFLSRDVYTNIFRCERNDTAWERYGYDTTLACRSNA